MSTLLSSLSDLDSLSSPLPLDFPLTEESVDTEDLCSEDSGPTKKKKNRREIDKKVLGRKKKDKKKDEHSAKRRRTDVVSSNFDQFEVYNIMW
jgi:hypothetical protein